MRILYFNNDKENAYAFVKSIPLIAFVSHFMLNFVTSLGLCILNCIAFAGYNPHLHHAVSAQKHVTSNNIWTTSK